MTRRPRLLYLMHVDWRWIKQRPHFFAEALADSGWDVTVGFAPTWRRMRLPANGSQLALHPLPLIPRWTHGGAETWNSSVGRRAIRALIRRTKPDAIWISHAGLATALDDVSVPLVYDVMDLNAHFHGAGAASATALEQERTAWTKATRLYCSSTTIRTEIERHEPGLAEKTRYVPNAYDDRRDWTEFPRRAESTYRLAYIGTISEWLDLDLLQQTLERVPDTEVLLVGPSDRRLPVLPRLRVAGVVPHERIPQLAAEIDCFLLPFSVTPLVRGVDPVKLYEYLAMRRPIVSCHYPELERFRGLANFYTQRDECIDLIRRRPPLPDEAAVTSFLADNTWRQRAKLVSADLDEITA